MCLVEVEKSPKHVASCAMPALPGQTFFFVPAHFITWQAMLWSVLLVLCASVSQIHSPPSRLSPISILVFLPRFASNSYCLYKLEISTGDELQNDQSSVCHF
jgi:hypothetical protein